MNRIAEMLSLDGVGIPLRASFLGLKWVPLFALGHNNLNPSLMLFENRIEIRSVKRHKFPCDDIQQVGARVKVETV